MSIILHILIPFVVSLIAAIWIYPKVLRIALLKDVVDNPNARKLQRVPVPVLGGVAVMFGILVALSVCRLFYDCSGLFTIMLAMSVLLYVGTIDDITELSPNMRFLIETFLVVMLIYTCDYSINDFHGLWGIGSISPWIGVPLTIVSVVGIINAINLIDGVDGYSSGYSVISCLLFGLMFHALGNVQMVVLAAVVAASLLPFFLHNVFGKHSKMFIGDAGTLSLGIIFSVFVTTLLSTPSGDVIALESTLGLVPFTLAVLCVPIFDTLRVMSSRMIRGKSPFNPDKTHLHHLYIELGYSHIGTTLSIITTNLLVVLCWYIAYRCGASIDLQLYLVVLLGLLVTFGFYAIMKRQIKTQGPLYRLYSRIGATTHVKRKGFWQLLQRWADKSTSEDSSTEH